ncbi:MAG: methyltransferase domain-containing protein [Myxococcota bacterium]
MGAHDQDVQAFFRQWSQTYDDAQLQDRVYLPLQEQIVRRLQWLRPSLKPLDRILDVGVGTGQSLAALRALVPAVLGLDPSTDMLRRARERLPEGCGVMRATAEHVPLRDASVDACVSCFSIHWWPDVEAGLREMHRVLRPHGVALIMIPTTSLLGLQSMSVGWRHPAQLTHWKPPSWYARQAQAAGLTTRLPREVARGAWLLEARRGDGGP